MTAEVVTAPARDEVVDCARWWSTRGRPVLDMPTVRLAPHSDTSDGAGVRIALLGGRVDVTHPDIRGAAVVGPAQRGANLPDPTGHATACASLLVGQGQAYVRGLAPEAELLTVPVLGFDGRTADEQIVRAVRWALVEGAQVLVLPFGRRHRGRRVAITLRAAAEAGVRVFVAAGDLGPDVLAFPASVSGVVAVTGHDHDAILPGCSAQADVAAPGHDVPAAGRDRLVRLQGSAPAAVLAAGAWAVGLLGDVGLDDDPRGSAVRADLDEHRGLVGGGHASRAQ